jgi:hypothetical protein
MYIYKHILYLLSLHILTDINDRFGKVNNRRKRADLFLPYNDEKIQFALKEAVGNLSPLLLVLDDMEKEGSYCIYACVGMYIYAYMCKNT